MSETITNLQQRIRQLETELLKSKKINRALMERMEKSVENINGSFGLFENTIHLQQEVKLRTEALELTNSELKQEIKNRKKIEKDLHDSQRVLQDILDTIPMKIFWKDKELRFLGGNRDFAESAGIHDPKDLAGKTDNDMPWRKQAEKLRHDEQEVIDSGVPNMLSEIPLLDSKKNTVWLLTNRVPMRDTDGNVNGVLVAYLDITEYRQAVDALRENDKRFKEIFQALPIGVLMIDAETLRIVDVNASATALIGLPREEILDQLCRKFICSEESGPCPFFDDSQTIENIERTLCIGTGEKVPVLKSLQSIRHHGKKYLIESLVDLRAQKKAEEALKKAKAASEEASRSKSEFLANMSHEIRTPMNGVVGMAGLLAKTELNIEQKQYVQAIQSSSESLMTIINDILDFSKIEAKKLDFESIDIDLRDCIGDCLHSLIIRAAEKGIELAYHVEQDVPERIVGDPGRLRQILVNLVGNSIKFTEKGEVVVSVSKESMDEDFIILRFDVADTGIGISEEKQKRIFEAFSQVDASTTRKYGGTGLGLTICSSLVELMEGKIWVESRIGKGSTFSFTVRLGVSKSPQTFIVPGTLSALKNLSVLVVDDNATNRRIMEGILTGWGFKSSTAGSGPEALNLLSEAVKKDHPFQLILLDGNMPVMDGFMLADILRKHSEHRSIPIIMLTSSGIKGESEQCREIGISLCLTKPVKPSVLLDSILMLFGTEKQKETASVISRPEEEMENPLRILLAEDNTVNQKIASTMLKHRGHQVVIVENGIDAVAALDSSVGSPFDLVLMDIQMPVMDGLNATRCIREKEKKTGTHIPIIALTAHAMKGDKEMCLEAGMDNYVSKPIRIEEFHNVIKQVLPQEKKTSSSSVPAEGKKETDSDEVFNFQETLDRLEGDVELCKEIMSLFLENSPEDVIRIRNAVMGKDTDELYRRSHALKGSAANFTAARVVEAAHRLEKMGETHNLENSTDAFNVLETEISRLQSALEKQMRLLDL